MLFLKKSNTVYHKFFRNKNMIKIKLINKYHDF